MPLRIVSLLAVSTLCAGFAPAPMMPNSNTRLIVGNLGRAGPGAEQAGFAPVSLPARAMRSSPMLRASSDDSKKEKEFQQLKISFVTGNEMKRREVNTILNSCGATKGPTPDTSLVDLRLLNVDLPEIQELNTEAIAKNKAIQAAQLANGPCVVEDTSLAFFALGGMPGPFIKFFQGAPACQLLLLQQLLLLLLLRADVLFAIFIYQLAMESLCILLLIKF